MACQVVGSECVTLGITMELKQIEAELMAGNTAPGQLAEFRVLLSGKYAFATNQLEEVLIEKPIHWNKMRPDHKSDTACERAWEATDLGIKERHWKFQIKKIEKMMTAIKTLIEVKTAEAYNQV